MQTKKLLFKAFYLLVHNAFRTFIIFLNTLVFMWKKCVNYYDKLVINNQEESLLRNVKNITKVPRHLTVLLGEDLPSYKDLAKLVVWSIASDISFISFYDSKGILKKSQEKLKKIVENIKHPADHIIWHEGGQSSYTNGFKGKKIYVRTLSASDGRETIVDVTKQLASVKFNIITQESVDSYLKHSYVFPDPDLGLFFGANFNLLGYPPWQIRITEFLSLHSHHDLNWRTFLRALYRYSKTEQRLGK